MNGKTRLMCEREFSNLIASINEHTVETRRSVLQLSGFLAHCITLFPNIEVLQDSSHRQPNLITMERAQCPPAEIGRTNAMIRTVAEAKCRPGHILYYKTELSWEEWIKMLGIQTSSRIQMQK
jgi:hypothetical protein